jgi:hypothetical protein
MGTGDREPLVFLLSPASPASVRAEQLTSPRARFGAALRFRSEEGVPIEEAFSFMSSLYFRGKITYARHFALPPPELGDTGIFVIAPGFGLVPPSWCITGERMKKLRKTPVDLKNRSYCEPLRQHARQLFPRDFAGAGDMKRGGMLLRAAREDREMEYVTLDAPRRRVRA